MKTFHMLLFQIPNAFAWKLIPTSSALIGCFFLAASCYFLYGLLRPSWQNACGQLWAFLAYDLVLIIPFLLRFASVSPERLPSLFINTAVLVYSGALALYYLFVNKATRMWGNLLFNKPISRSSDLSLSSGKKPSRKKADSHRLTCDERDLSRNLCPKLRGGSQKRIPCIVALLWGQNPFCDGQSVLRHIVFHEEVRIWLIALDNNWATIAWCVC